MARDLENKTAVITGGAMGIGLSIAEHFLKNNAKVVVILDLNEIQGKHAVDKLNSKYGKDKAVFYKCDVTTDLEDVSKTVINHVRHIDILVNNAGILDSSAKRTIDVNVTALIEWSFKFLDHIKKDKQNEGTIINLASIYGFKVDEHIPVYKASKFAVLGFTRSLGHVNNYKKTGVRVVAICPGFTTTELVSDTKLKQNNTITEEFRKFMDDQKWQDEDAVGNAAVDVYRRAESGTVWLIEGNQPITEVV